jgi:plasmid stability protein
MSRSLISFNNSDIKGVVGMPAMTIRNIPEETHRALKALAASHGRSAEAEVRAILQEAVFPHDRLRLGSLLQEIGIAAGGVDLDISRDARVREPLDLA